MSKKHPGTSYVIVRNVAQYPAVADTWTVVYFPTHENLSHYESESEARAAVRRYKDADARRPTRADMLKPLTEDRSLGKLLDGIEAKHRAFLNPSIREG